MADDPSEPLFPKKREAFACAVAQGMSQAESYRTHISGKATAKTSHEEGCRLASAPKVAARIAWLKAEAAKVARKQADGLVLSIAEKRAFLARVVRTPLGEIDRDSDLCQEWSRSDGPQSSTERLKMPSKLDAIKIDNDLAEEGAEAKGASALADALAKIREATHGS